MFDATILSIATSLSAIDFEGKPKLNLTPQEEPASRKPRIWLVNQFFGQGSAPTGRLLDDLAIQLQKAGWQVTVLTGAGSYRETEAQIHTKFSGDIRRLGWRKSGHGSLGKLCYWLAFAIHLAGWTLWRRQPEVILMQTTPPLLHVWFSVWQCLRGRHARLVLWNQDTYPELLVASRIFRETSWIYRGLRRLNRWSIRRLETVVVLDSAMRDHFLSQLTNPQPEVALIPNWDTTAPGIAGNLSENLKQLSAGYLHKLVYSGNLGLGHDLEPLLQALAQQPEQTDIFLVVVGTGGQTSALAERAKREGWRFVGFSPYLDDSAFLALLNWADVGLVALDARYLGLMSPSKMHAWLGAGKPVLYLGPRNSNVAETIDQFDCGWICEPTDSTAVQQALSEMRTNPLIFERKGLAARQAWAERHSSQAAQRAWALLIAQWQARLRGERS